MTQRPSPSEMDADANEKFNIEEVAAIKFGPVPKAKRIADEKNLTKNGECLKIALRVASGLLALDKAGINLMALKMVRTEDGIVAHETLLEILDSNLTVAKAIVGILEGALARMIVASASASLELEARS